MMSTIRQSRAPLAASLLLTAACATTPETFLLSTADVTFSCNEILDRKKIYHSYCEGIHPPDTVTIPGYKGSKRALSQIEEVVRCIYAPLGHRIRILLRLPTPGIPHNIVHLAGEADKSLERFDNLEVIVGGVATRDHGNAQKNSEHLFVVTKDDNGDELFPVDIAYVTAHEIGHALGLTHSAPEEASYMSSLIYSEEPGFKFTEDEARLLEENTRSSATADEPPAEIIVRNLSTPNERCKDIFDALLEEWRDL